MWHHQPPPHEIVSENQIIYYLGAVYIALPFKGECNAINKGVHCSAREVHFIALEMQYTSIWVNNCSELKTIHF